MFRNYRHNNPNPIPQWIEALRQEFKRIVAWHKPRDRMEAPPLAINGQTVIEPEAKAEALSMTLLERNSEEEDLETGWVPTVPRRRLL
ncbi:hypothetical protein SMACR_09156 [Sordaria macrospora]|uniref:WGS project CABT00000000 data, contig 2.74 n=2 Tax=Sordaria macrospora TaxID=5147 RepID=F7WBD4_SORMK|nr:uncharacterized protein SMAC_09156 [Sordaria macrospora k-hell]KAA8629114.1 hypothetical protein SMACR_09156 [Sordaria macrospora]WPJ58600.1 hypothetical protein SMAC4_09156 [Sordaria macrospora]CCC14945.1 unnamed protein product [Sordaria macrospora k-hell]